MFCVDDLRKMLDTEELEKRSFISKVDTLKDYIEFLDNLEKESKKDKVKRFIVCANKRKRINKKNRLHPGRCGILFFHRLQRPMKK